MSMGAPRASVVTSNHALYEYENILGVRVSHTKRLLGRFGQVSMMLISQRMKNSVLFGYDLCLQYMGPIICFPLTLLLLLDISTGW